MLDGGLITIGAHTLNTTEQNRIETKKRIYLFVVSCEATQTDKSVFILLLSGKTNNVVINGLRSALPLARARKPNNHIAQGSALGVECIY